VTPSASGMISLMAPCSLKSFLTFSISKGFCHLLFSLRHAENLIDHFWIPMTMVAYNEFLELQNFLNSLTPIDLIAKDSWHFIWEQHRYFSCHSISISFGKSDPEGCSVGLGIQVYSKD
jgi:hypothetical protein